VLHPYSTGRPNTIPSFPVFLPSSPLQDSPSPLIIQAWGRHLSLYPGNLQRNIIGILKFGCQIGADLEIELLSQKNQASTAANTVLISEKISADLDIGRIAMATSPVMSSPLGLVPKADGGWRRIHNLSSPSGRSVNDSIPIAFATLQYSTVDQVLQHVIHAGRSCIIVKRDIKDAFRNIPLSIEAQRLMGFSWKGVVYFERCLSFGLRTAPFLFNLFAEGFHWILIQHIPNAALEHYLDDFIFILSDASILPQLLSVYNQLSDELGIPRNESKNIEGTTAEVLGYIIDTLKFELRLSPLKQATTIKEIDKALSGRSLTLVQSQKLAGRLAWSARVIRLGRSYNRSIWEFISTFTKAGGYPRRRLTAELRQDLLWWRDALTLSNGILFFDDTDRKQFHLFSDASGILGYGAFFFLEDSRGTTWPPYSVSLPQDDSLSCYPNAEHRLALINEREVRAITTSFQLWATRWEHSSVCIHTDNTVALSGFQNTVVKGPGNYPLREILQLAAAYDITLYAEWVSSAENGLADALSRFDRDRVLLLCPHWDTSDLPLPYASLLHLI